MTEQLLIDIGRRVRARRQALGLTLKSTASRAGLSPRFVSQIEAGLGNVAVGRLSALATALEVPLTALLEDRSAPVDHMLRLLEGRSEREQLAALEATRASLSSGQVSVVALLGMRGAGKSTVGPLLAPRLQARFVELDEAVEAEAGLSVAEIFALHGESFYRRLEHRCLRELLDRGARVVVAPSGGIVSDDAAWTLLREECVTVWLRARPEEHMSRVVAQGDHRPMSQSEAPMVELRAILAARTPRYEQASVTVSTSTAVDAVVDQVERGVLAFFPGR